MNFLMIYASIFCFGVSAGLVLSHLIASRDVLPNRRKKAWKNRF